MTDSAALAATHAACFVTPRPWTAAEFDDLLAARGTFLLGDPDAFLLGRSLAGEAELLTLAVSPAMRRQGHGQRLLAHFARHAGETGAEEAFLEVASDNVAARALYLRNGWVEAGLRPRYYGPVTDAIVMRSCPVAAQQGG
ncbi:GNAT family N-acetyltransferase [Paracoccus sp. PARArs4]|uniref:GNAT family N-acetyltransferase n=1 Tax=Paracoccus sp. PARArs4 TaxID=2853442 RepID=UPI0024A6D98F|nr:GNAT family N-acetyltransferase [Paracoccus sp. PARArs4]